MTLRAVPAKIPTQKLGCLTIDQYHPGCGGRLIAASVIVFNGECMVRLKCQDCFEKLGFTGKHVGAHA